MRNEIIALGNPSNILSGAGRSQAFKEVSFAGLVPITDDPEFREKNFFSILTRLGSGKVMETTEKKDNGKLKLTQGQLPDEVKADNAIAVKQKIKQPKTGSIAKCLTSDCPETFGRVMVSLSSPPPVQSDLPAALVVDLPVSACEAAVAAVASGLSDGELLPEMRASKHLNVECDFREGKLTMTPVLSASNRDSALPFEGSEERQGQSSELSSTFWPVSFDAAQPDNTALMVPDVFQGLLQSGAEAVLKSKAAQETKAAPETKATPEIKVVLESNTVSKPKAVSESKVILKAKTVSESKVFFESKAFSEPREVLGSDHSCMVRGQAVPVEGLPRNPGQRQEVSPAQEPVSPSIGLLQADALKEPQAFEGRLQLDGQAVLKPKTVPESQEVLEVKTDSETKTALENRVVSESKAVFESKAFSEPRKVLGSDHSGSVRGQAPPEEGLPRNPGQRQEVSPTQELVSPSIGLLQADALKEPQAFEGRLQLDDESVLKSKAVPESQEVLEVKTDSKTKSALENRVVSESEAVFESKAFSEPKNVLEADHSGMVRVQAFQEGQPKGYGQQQRSPSSTPDKAYADPSADRLDPDSKMNQFQAFSLNTLSGAVREKAPKDQLKDPERPQVVKVKSDLFFSANGAVESGQIAEVSSETSNSDETRIRYPDDNGTSKYLVTSSLSGKNAGSEEKAPVQLPEAESGEWVLNNTREIQVEKAPWVNPSSNSFRSQVPSFHVEVVKQIVDQAPASLKSGKSEIQIDLKPESLGHLRLQVSTLQHQVTVKILAENTQVKEMIESHASLIKYELQEQGIHVASVKVDMLMSGGSDFAYSQHEGTAFKQTRHESAYGSGQNNMTDSTSPEPDSSEQINPRGGSLVDYFA